MNNSKTTSMQCTHEEAHTNEETHALKPDTTNSKTTSMQHEPTLKTLEENSTLHGFYVERKEALPEIEGFAYTMRHKKSGARLLFLQNNDNNKSFSISFKTPPNNSTGVFHILEHSVLCGSKKFPVKEPFVNLIKNSMQTFLNAFTFPDKTMYPVASTNSKDLLNLIDVYMDAVLQPAIYTNKHIFQQEGWHIELKPQQQEVREKQEEEQEEQQEPKGKQKQQCEEETNETPDTTSTCQQLSYNGVVYNEMKGDYSDPESVLYHALMAQLFPDSAYCHDSGGNPAYIPELSYQDFLDTHSRHYSLKNSYLTLYGNLDIDLFLAFLNQNYLEPYAHLRDSSKPINKLDIQKPVQSFDNIVRMQTAPENACMALGYVVGDKKDPIKLYATKILVNALTNNNESPLKQQLLSEKLGNEINAYVMDDLLQPYIMLEARGLPEEQHTNSNNHCKTPSQHELNRFQDTVTNIVHKLYQNGLDHCLLEASLAQLEFSFREGPKDYPNGIIYAINSLSGWLYSDELSTSYLHYETICNELRRLLKTNYYNQLLKELFLDNPHTASVYLEPTAYAIPSKTDKKLKQTETKLTPQKAAHIARETETLRTYQEKEDSPQALASLPCLKPSDIGSSPQENPLETPATWEETPYGKVLRHHVQTHGICYTHYFYDISNLSNTHLFYVELLCFMLGKLDTAHHTAAELQTLLQSKLGELVFQSAVFENPYSSTDAYPKLHVSSSSLESNVSYLAQLTNEICLSTQFDDFERMRTLIQQQKIHLEQSFCLSGNNYAVSCASACISIGSAITQKLGGVEYYYFLCDLLNHFDKLSQQLSATLSRLSKTIFCKCSKLFSFTGSDDCLKKYHESFKRSFNTYYSCLDGIKIMTQTGLSVPLSTKKDHAYIIPSSVVFNALTYDLRSKQTYKQTCNKQLSSCNSFPLNTKKKTLSDKNTLSANNQHWWALSMILNKVLSYDYLWNNIRVKGGAYGAYFSIPRTGTVRFHTYRDPHIDLSFQCIQASAHWLANFEPNTLEWEGYLISTVASLDAPLKPHALILRQCSRYISGISNKDITESRKAILQCHASNLKKIAPTLESVTSRGIKCVFGNDRIIQNSNYSWYESNYLITTPSS